MCTNDDWDVDFTQLRENLREACRALPPIYPDLDDHEMDHAPRAWHNISNNGNYPGETAYQN